MIPHSLQFGVVKKTWVIPAIHILKETVKHYLESFDREWQDGLLFILNNIGIRGKLRTKKAAGHVQYNGVTRQVFRMEQEVR